VVAWYEVDPSDSLSSSRVRRRGLIGQARTDSGWPVVATDGAGNVLVTYSRASAVSRPPEFLSAWGAVIPPGSLDPQSALLTSGTATFDYVDGEERWGDFNGISRDPTNPQRVWMVNQYARDTGSPTTDVWQQVVHEVSAP
jgi:hypothetical protein